MLSNPHFPGGRYRGDGLVSARGVTKESGPLNGAQQRCRDVYIWACKTENRLSGSNRCGILHIGKTG